MDIIDLGQSETETPALPIGGAACAGLPTALCMEWALATGGRDVRPVVEALSAGTSPTQLCGEMSLGAEACTVLNKIDSHINPRKKPFPWKLAIGLSIVGSIGLWVILRSIERSN